jgi:bifunctional non-homologous end joining protein LigD
MLLGSGPPSSGGNWVAEAKWDGMRALVETAGGAVPAWQGWSKSNTPIQGWFPELAGLGAQVGGHHAVLDGEVLALDRAGRPSFAALQTRIGRSPRKGAARPAVHFIAFDLLWLDGVELVNEPWHRRRAALEDLAGHGLTLSPVYDPDDAAALTAGTRALALEGVVHKRVDAIYRPGRRCPSAWRKHKHTEVSELWVGGLAWTARCRRAPALLVGDRLPDGQLRYRGCVEVATAGSRRAELAAILAGAAVDTSPFAAAPRWAGPAC